MKTILFAIAGFFVSNNYSFAQEPRVAYCFKVFDDNNKEINNSNKNYQLRSLSMQGCPETIDDTIYYTNTDCYGNCPFSSFWEIKQEYNIRNYLWIQIIELKNKDTMNIFLKKNAEDIFYDNPDNDPNHFDGKVFQTDSIKFQKGNFIIKKRPKFNDWKNLNKDKNPKNIEKLNGRIEDYLKEKFDQYGNEK